MTSLGSAVCTTCSGPALDTRTGCWECPRGGDDWDCHECVADAIGYELRLLLELRRPVVPAPQALRECEPLDDDWWPAR